MAGHLEPKPAEPATTADTPTPPRGDFAGFPITQKKLTEAWNSFADTLKTEDARLFSTLTAHTPTLEGETKIVFQISNPLQKEPLQKIQSTLLQHLKATLNNEKAEIEIIVAEKNETAKAYTAEDKFAQMSRKNPALMTLKQQFHLDFE